ncbi:short-chain dehydrogenase [Plectosphaerella cucumerina]|uniref:Short-chain dehydrogenase n=1 Tax=Plectosphaerella cucumerina TaxID=40658 RepID=A0A8K0X5J7_9PEZI|nr:short-chain dehydrogenase [Plectosphaerella cucumerina]
MSNSWLITGVSRGIGFALLKNLSENPENIVIGLVRDKVTTDKKIADEIGNRSNIHIFQADLLNFDDLKNTVEPVSQITGGRIDNIIANAALLQHPDVNFPIGVAAENPERLEEAFLDTFRVNVLGQVKLFTVYMPLLLKGRSKKAVAISSAMGDLTMIRTINMKLSAPYAVSKAALNAVIAKYHAQYHEEGVLFLAICPGFVETGQYGEITPKEAAYVGEMVESFSKHAPDARKREPYEAANDILSVMNKASLENGDGGQFLSHLGSTTQWL